MGGQQINYWESVTLENRCCAALVCRALPEDDSIITPQMNKASVICAQSYINIKKTILNLLIW